MQREQDVMIEVKDLKKQYRLGQIGSGTLHGDIQSWWARKRGKEDPNAKIGTEQRLVGSNFMALNGLSFTVRRGEAVGIIGANGAGKSTLLKLLTHVTAPTEGDIDLYGRVASMLEVGTGFHSEMTGRENIYLNGAILGMTRAEIDAKLDQIVDFSECREFIDTPVKRYSSGMYVKLGFAVAAHLDSEIMIMDEVLAVGDMRFQQKCLGQMGEQNKNNRTILYVSHNMATVRQLCTRAIVLDQGKIIYDGNVETAIAYYSKNNVITQVSNDLHDIERTAGRGIKLRMERLEFVDREGAMYCSSESMHIKLTMRVHEDLKNIGVRFPVRNREQVVIGMVDVPNITAMHAGEERTFLFDIPLSALPGGHYSFYVSVYEYDEYGSARTVDELVRNFGFEVVDDTVGTFPWVPQCGYVRFTGSTVEELPR